MNLNKRFKKLASLITCGAICAVMLFGRTSPAFSHALAKSTPGESEPSVTAESSAEPTSARLSFQTTGSLHRFHTDARLFQFNNRIRKASMSHLQRIHNVRFYL